MLNFRKNNELSEFIKKMVEESIKKRDMRKYIPVSTDNIIVDVKEILEVKQLDNAIYRYKKMLAQIQMLESQESIAQQNILAASATLGRAS